MEADRDLSEVPLAQRRRIPQSLAEYERLSATRNEAIASSYGAGGYSMTEIGEYPGLHYARLILVLSAEIAKRKT